MGCAGEDFTLDSQNRRAKVYFGTQADSNPPTIVLFTNGPELFDNTYQRYLLKTFRDRLPFHDVPMKMYLRVRSREDQLPGEREKPETPPQKKPRKPKAGLDLTGLRFRSTVSEEELKGEKGRYESELWKDL